MFKRYKAAKRVLALLLCGCLVFGSVYQTRQKVYASAVGAIIGTGATISVETAIAYLLGILGVTAASEAVYRNRDELTRWGRDQLDDFDSWARDNVAESQEEIEGWKTSLKSFTDKLATGILDTGSSVWSAFREWVGSNAYAAAGSSASGNVTVGINARFKTVTGKTTDSNIISEFSVSPACAQQSFVSFGRPNKYGAVYYYLVYFAYTADVVSVTEHRYLESDGSQFGSDMVRSMSGSESEPVWRYIEFSPYDTWTVKDGVAFLPNFQGVFAYGDSLSSVYAAAKELAANGIDENENEKYGYAGGISNVFGNAGTLAGVDVVGRDGTTALGQSDIPIAWPGDDALDRILAGIKEGTATWTDVLEKVGVVAVDVAGENAYDIDEDGTSAKQHVYAPASDVPNVKDDTIDIPAEGTAPSTALGSYTLAGLEKLFPFCLPFDLMDFIGVLDATPQAPKFTIPFKYPTRGGTETYDIVIDLSSFDSVAELLRDMECLAFIVGLIMITRSRMIRG